MKSGLFCQAGIGIWIFMSLAPRAAYGADVIRACVSAHAEGQTLRRQGLLLAARERFLFCTSRECPAVIVADCAKFGQEAEAATPTVILAAVTSEGEDIPRAAVRIDDAAELIALDGRAIPFDPGPHRFTFELRDGRTSVISALLRESEKYRRLAAVFGKSAGAPLPVMAAKPARASPQLPPTRPAALDSSSPPRDLERPGISLSTYAFGGAAALGLLSFSAFAWSGRAKQSELRRCAPSCSDEAVNAMYHRYLVADISLGVAVASLAAGAYVLLRSEPAPGPGPRPAVARTRIGAALDRNARLGVSLVREF